MVCVCVCVCGRNLKIGNLDADYIYLYTHAQIHTYINYRKYIFVSSGERIKKHVADIDDDIALQLILKMCVCSAFLLQRRACSLC